jgi:thioredoxin 1
VSNPEEQVSNTIEVNETNFQSEVLESETPVLVDFGAEWCGPCKMLDPVVDELAEDWGDAVKVVKLDIDQSPDIAMQYHVMGVPTLIVFKDGEAQDRLTGYRPKQKIVEQFSTHLQLA